VIGDLPAGGCIDPLTAYYLVWLVLYTPAIVVKGVTGFTNSQKRDALEARAG